MGRPRESVDQPFVQRHREPKLRAQGPQALPDVVAPRVQPRGLDQRPRVHLLNAQPLRRRQHLDCSARRPPTAKHVRTRKTRKRRLDSPELPRHTLPAAQHVAQRVGGVKVREGRARQHVPLGSAVLVVPPV
jgi:hypothetical protein